MKYLAVLGLFWAIILSLPSVNAMDNKLDKDVELARHDFPYPSKYVKIKDANMHYVDTGGTGSTIVMLHGQPSWSYLWRNVIPHLEDKHRVIALDLIGFGKSDKPDIGYTVPEHAEYLQGFMDALKLKDVTLVIHDWGSVLGFDYAANNPDNVKGIAFMEALVPVPPAEAPFSPEKPKLSNHSPSLFEQFFPIMGQIKSGDMELAKKLIFEENVFLEKAMLPSIQDWLTEDELNAYREPFANGKSRLPMLQFALDAPVDGKNPKYVMDMVHKYTQYLHTQKDLPKLLLHLDKGWVVQRWAVEWQRQNLKDITIYNMGSGGHFMQEHNPDGIGSAIALWMDNNNL